MEDATKRKHRIENENSKKDVERNAKCLYAIKNKIINKYTHIGYTV